VLEGPPWPISNNPHLGPLYGAEQEVVDHAIWPSADGRWHLWACIRGTTVGRLFYRWEGASPDDAHWEPRGIAMRAERRYGESLNDRDGQEWIQAPHVIVHQGRYWMFYGGHNTESGECQICLATSPDGREFTRYRDAQGYSRLFVGPGEARDPMVISIGDIFYCYYAGHDTGRRAPGKIYCRTSRDLIHWSEPVTVNWGGSAGDGLWSAECPFVVHMDGYYYLFRTSRYRAPALTHVYRSQDPEDFGRGNDDKKVATLRVAAPEVVQAGDRYYISTVEALREGVQMIGLRWPEDAGATG
jgi:hypothetical protein